MKKFDYNGRKNICGNRVRCLRTARRWSQAALAAKMQTQGVIMEQDVVSKIESGDRLVTLSTCAYAFKSARYIAVGRIHSVWADEEM